MAGFKRRFLVDPGADILLNTPSVNILDIAPPSPIQGAGSGTVCMVAEYEDGAFEQPTEIFSATDLESGFGGSSPGGFGFSRAAGQFRDPVARRTGGVELWNGNAFIALFSKTFNRLVVVRVDNRAGVVTLSRQACTAGGAGPYDLEPGQTLIVNPDGVADTGGTITIAAAVGSAIGGAYTAPTAGDTLELKIGTTTDNGITRVITFAGGEAVAAAVTLINNVVGAPPATPVAVDSGATIDLQSIVRGSGGRLEIVGGTAVADLGHVVGVSTGTGDAFNIDSTTQAEIIALANATLVESSLDIDGAGNLRVCNIATPLTGTIEIDGASTMAAGLGLTTGTTVDAADNTEITIAAGTVFTDSTGTSRWLALQTITAVADGLAAITMPVRPANDDDTEPSAVAAAIDRLEVTLTEAFTITNAAALVRMNAAQLDLAYLNAIDSTVDISGVSHDINIIVSARQSAAIRRRLREDAVDTSAIGHLGRKAIIRPPIDTDRVTAKLSTDPGVGFNRDQRVTYQYPAWSIQVPEIAAVGALAGGTGFTDDGVIDVGSDTWMASVRSILNPEEDAGQRLSNTNVGSLNVLALQDAFNTDAGGIGLTIDDYISFEANGISAPRVDRTSGALATHSDVTSVDPTVDSVLVPNLRRYMSDFIQDSLSAFGSGEVKKLSTFLRRQAIRDQVQQFLATLRSVDVPQASRIEAFSVDAEGGNTQALLDRGLFVLLVNVKLFQIIKALVFRTNIGPTVTVDEGA
jgi:hypothetical protein